MLESIFIVSNQSRGVRSNLRFRRSSTFALHLLFLLCDEISHEIEDIGGFRNTHLDDHLLQDTLNIVMLHILLQFRLLITLVMWLLCGVANGEGKKKGENRPS